MLGFRFCHPAPVPHPDHYGLQRRGCCFLSLILNNVCVVLPNLVSIPSVPFGGSALHVTVVSNMSISAVDESPQCNPLVTPLFAKECPSPEQEAKSSPAIKRNPAEPVPAPPLSAGSGTVPHQYQTVVPPAYWVHGSCNAEALYGPGILQ